MAAASRVKKRRVSWRVITPSAWQAAYVRESIGMARGASDNSWIFRQYLAGMGRGTAKVVDAAGRRRR